MSLSNYYSIRLKKGLGILITLNLALSSCTEIVTVGPPKGQLSSEVVFASDASAISAMSGLYSQMIESNLSFLSNALTIYPGMSADELVNTVSNDRNDEFTQNTLTADNTGIRNIWNRAYSFIYQANAILEGLNASLGVSSPVKDQLRGEALFVRAFCHFYLTNLFGDIPLVTSTAYRENIHLSRTPSGQVYQQIIGDLEEAGRLMSGAYPSGKKGRPNKWTAIILLARAYLYQGEYSKAEAASSAVIESGAYTLQTNLNEVFLAGSTETIWELVPVNPNTNTWEGNLFIPGPDMIPSYIINNALVTSFEPGDGRQREWLDSVKVNNTIYYYPYKYKVRSGSVVTENYVVFRLAEAFLIRSEARAKQDRLAEAQEDLNVIRNRAGLSDTDAQTRQQLLLAIEIERRAELFAEWGHRWFDLKRTGRVDLVLKPVKRENWQLTDALYPIPAREILMNPFLTQNPGYL